MRQAAHSAVLRAQLRIIISESGVIPGILPDQRRQRKHPVYIAVKTCYIRPAGLRPWQAGEPPIGIRFGYEAHRARVQAGLAETQELDSYCVGLCFAVGTVSLRAK